MDVINIKAATISLLTFKFLTLFKRLIFSNLDTKPKVIDIPDDIKQSTNSTAYTIVIHLNPIACVSVNVGSVEPPSIAEYTRCHDKSIAYTIVIHLNPVTCVAINVGNVEPPTIAEYTRSHDKSIPTESPKDNEFIIKDIFIDNETSFLFFKTPLQDIIAGSCPHRKP